MSAALIRRYVTHPRNIYDAQPLTNAVFVLTGVSSPHRQTSSEPWTHTIARLLLMLVQWCGCLVSLIITLERDENFISFFFESDVSKVTSLIEKVLSMVCVTTVYTMSFVRRDRQQRLFALLYAVDGRLTALMWRTFGADSTPGDGFVSMSALYRRTVVFTVCFMVGNGVVLTLYLVGSYAMQWGLDRTAHMYAWVSYFWPQMVLSMVVDQAMCWMWQVGRRFGQLNQVGVFIVCLCGALWVVWGWANGFALYTNRRVVYYHMEGVNIAR